MSSSNPGDHIGQFLKGSLSEAEAEQLYQLATVPENADSLVTQRTMDQLLRLVAAGDQKDDFVAGCVDAFKKEFSDEAIIKPEPAGIATTLNHVGWLIGVAASLAVFAAGAWWFITDRLPAVKVPTATSAASGDIAPKTLDQARNELAVETEKAAPTASPAETSKLTRISKEQLAYVEEKETSVKDTVPENPTPAIAAKSKRDEAPEILPLNPDEMEHEHSKSIASAPFGRIISNRSAVWSDDSSSKLTEGKYQLLDGSARLKLDNGTLIRIAGPAELELLDEQSIHLLSGELLLEIPRKVNAFTCQLGEQKFLNPQNAKLFLSAVNDGQWESLLMRGSIEFAKEQEHGDIIELSKTGLCQTAFARSDQESDTPATFIAKGHNQFMGQCFDNHGTIAFESPDNMQHFLKTVVANQDIGWSPFSQNVDDLNADLAGLKPGTRSSLFRGVLAKHLQTRFKTNSEILSDGNETASTSFRGSLSINGVERHFDSKEEFDRAKQMMEQGILPAQPATPTQTVQTQSFTVGNKQIEFSSLEMFNQLRRKMNQ